MASYNEISTSTLARLIGTPDCPRLLDVRIEEDFQEDRRFIPGALRMGHLNAGDFANQLRDKSVVVYCQKGLKLSQGAAAVLRCEGIKAEVLEGGHYAWKDANLPLVRADKIPTGNDTTRSTWVTKHRPKIDRIACPWLIKRFVDPDAQFLFVAPSQVESVAERFNATPFDVQGVYWSHRADQCTFDTMLEEFDINNSALTRLATVVRGADTNNHSLAPECAGLLAVSLGLSRVFRDDLAQLEAGLGLYDALYRWARDATEEGHDWPSTKSTL